jgi:hypothetical protein
MASVRVSYSSIACAPPSEVIASVIKASEARNASSACSGLLGWSEWRYLQIIEGDSSCVNSIYKLIENDPRHNIEWCIEQEVKHRAIIPDLPMGFLDSSEFPELLKFHVEHDPLLLVNRLISCGAKKYPSSVSAAYLSFSGESRYL